MILKALSGVFSGDSFRAVENIAKEWIDTNKETAEANALMVKTLDPNGLMRRDISSRVGFLYSIYFMLTASLIALEFFGFGEQFRVAAATTKLTDLFLPITSLYGIIVTASFGVNYANVKQQEK